jgi:dihydroxyacetone kinase-like protein
MNKKTTLPLPELVSLLQQVCARIQENREFLSKLDAACGDGDHGVSMARGFRAVAEKLEKTPHDSPASLFRSVGMWLISSIGGATGPLMGTLFLEAGKSLNPENLSIDSPALASMFRAGLEGVCRRGGANPGEKTMVDALAPAVAAMESAAKDGDDPPTCLKKAAEAARSGAQSTESMVARQGKARYLGERAVGYQDPGANSIALIMEALADKAANLAAEGKATKEGSS